MKNRLYKSDFSSCYRGVAEVPWKNTTDPQHCATHIYACLQHHLPSGVLSLHPPQHPDALAQQLRDVYMHHQDHVEENSRAGGGRSERNGGDRRPSQVPTKTLFVSALRMKEVAQKKNADFQPPAAVVLAVARQKPSTVSAAKPREKATQATPLKNTSHQAATEGARRNDAGEHKNDSDGDSSDSEDDFFDDADSLFGTTTKASVRVPVPPTSTTQLPRSSPAKPTTHIASSTAAKKTVPTKRAFVAAEIDEQTRGVGKHTIVRSGGDKLEDVDNDGDSSDISLSDSSQSSSSCLLTQDSLQPVPEAAPALKLPPKLPLPSCLPPSARAPTPLSSASTAAKKSSAVLKLKPVRPPVPPPVKLTAVRETLPDKSTVKPKSNRAAKK